MKMMEGLSPFHPQQQTSKSLSCEFCKYLLKQKQLMNSQSNTIPYKINFLRTKIDQFCKENKRSQNTVRLIAVSKKKPTSDILLAYEAGQKDFGENYAQEFHEKFLTLNNYKDIIWHFIGYLQSNKVKLVVGKAHLIHTLDRFTLAKAIEKEAQKQGVIQECLLQVKLASEESKTGCPKDAVQELISSLQDFKHIRITGLMTIGSFTDNKTQTQNEFTELKNLRDTLNDKKILPHPLTELSMGMSSDYDLAIQEDATMIRIGTEIFGKRN